MHFVKKRYPRFPHIKIQKTPRQHLSSGGVQGGYHVLVGELFKGIDIHQCNQSRIREIPYGML